MAARRRLVLDTDIRGGRCRRPRQPQLQPRSVRVVRAQAIQGPGQRVEKELRGALRRAV